MMFCSDECEIGGKNNLYFKVSSIMHSCKTYDQLIMSFKYGKLAAEQDLLLFRSLNNLYELNKDRLQREFHDKIKQTAFKQL